VGSLVGEGVGSRVGIGVVGFGVGIIEGLIVGCENREIEGAVVII